MGHPWSNGDVLTDTDLNNLAPHRKIHTFATEGSTNSTSYVDVTTFDLSAISGLVTNVTLKADLEHDAVNGDTPSNYLLLAMHGATLGSLFMGKKGATYTSGELYYTGYWSGVETFALREINETTYRNLGLSCTQPIRLVDATTTFTVQQKTTHQYGKRKNIEVWVTYFPKSTDD
jgi:hypothetical protein